MLMNITKKLLPYLTVLCLSIPLKAQEINQESLQGIDSLVEQAMEKYKIPGLVIGLAHSSKLEKITPYGYTDLQNLSKTKDISNFELASLSKQFTASAIILLQQMGKLSIEDNLSDYFPETPTHWKGIKIKHLLWHTSGLPGLFPRDSFKNKAFSGYTKVSSEKLDEMMATNTVSKDLIIQSIITDQLDFDPGTKHNYSDVGYLLLGLIIDNITGSYRAFLENEIFKPSGLNNTYILDQEKVIPHQSRGYSLKGGEVINIMRTWDYEIPAHFGIFSNVYDLLKWNNIISSSQLLNEESRKLLFEKGKLDNGELVNYAGGWNVQHINGTEYIFHGGITGVNFYRLPQKDFALIVLTNLGYNGNDYVGSLGLATEILDYLRLMNTVNKDHVTSNGHKIVDTNNALINKVVGEYITIDGIEAEIYSNDDQLIFDCPAQGMKHEMAMLENEDWIILGLDKEYILKMDKKGALTSNLYRTFNKVAKR